MKNLIPALFTLLASGSIGLSIANAQNSENPDQAAAREVDVMNLSVPGYIDFCKSMIENSQKDPHGFARKSKKMLIGMLGWEEREQWQTVLDIDPMFNRSVIFILVANQNKIKMDKEDMEGFKNDCVITARKVQNEELQLVIANIYALALAMNEKLPDRE